MRIEIWIILITGFLIFNAYNDGKYMKMLMSYKKYYTMIFYAVIGIGIYILIKRNPTNGKNILANASNLVKYMPIDKSSMEMFSPILDITTNNEDGFLNHFNILGTSNLNNDNDNNSNINQRILNSGKNTTKRSVSETKKKYVAANQDWKCGNCQNQLDHTFEIDHKIRLEYGGGNDVGNLIALCRNCHGRKTASENM
jgi:hypothetical protein